MRTLDESMKRCKRLKDVHKNVHRIELTTQTYVYYHPC